MKLFKTLSIICFFTLSGFSFAEEPEQYNTVEELMEAHQDYHPSNGTFEMLDANEPSYRLSKIAWKSEPESVTYYENWRAAAYGIYNVFAHTPTESVSVTATPLQIPSINRADEKTLLEDDSITIQINREQALDAISGLIDVDSLNEVKTSTEYGYQWSEDFVSVYYEDRNPGLGALIAELKQYCTNDCE